MAGKKKVVCDDSSYIIKTAAIPYRQGRYGAAAFFFAMMSIYFAWGDFLKEVWYYIDVNKGDKPYK